MKLTGRQKMILNRPAAKVSTEAFQSAFRRWPNGLMPYVLNDNLGKSIHVISILNNYAMEIMI